MVTVYNMATGEQLGSHFTEPKMQSRHDAMAYAVDLQLQPVTDTTHHTAMRHCMPMDIAELSVEQFLFSQNN